MTKWRWEWKAAFSGPIVPGYLPEWVLCSWELYELKSWLLILSMPNSVLKAQSFPNPALTCSHSQLIVWADWKSNSKATFLASLFTTQQEFGTAIDTFRFSFYYSINLFNFSSIISRLAAVERRGSQSVGRHEDNMRWYAEVKRGSNTYEGKCWRWKLSYSHKDCASFSECLQQFEYLCRCQQRQWWWWCCQCWWCMFFILMHVCCTRFPQHENNINMPNITYFSSIHEIKMYAKKTGDMCTCYLR